MVAKEIHSQAHFTFPRTTKHSETALQWALKFLPPFIQPDIIKNHHGLCAVGACVRKGHFLR